MGSCRCRGFQARPQSVHDRVHVLGQRPHQIVPGSGFLAATGDRFRGIASRLGITPPRMVATLRLTLRHKIVAPLNLTLQDPVIATLSLVPRHHVITALGLIPRHHVITPLSLIPRHHLIAPLNLITPQHTVAPHLRRPRQRN
uniref:hypothetical protein n=1 Tax=Nocardia wallacei TaxID=480035 RepID=UPI002456DF93